MRMLYSVYTVQLISFHTYPVTEKWHPPNESNIVFMFSVYTRLLKIFIIIPIPADGTENV